MYRISRVSREFQSFAKVLVLEKGRLQVLSVECLTTIRNLRTVGEEENSEEILKGYLGLECVEEVEEEI